MLAAFTMAQVAGCMASQQTTEFRSVIDVQQQPQGVVATIGEGRLRLAIYSESIVRVTYSPKAEFPHVTELALVARDWAPTKWNLQTDDTICVVSTAKLRVILDRKTGLLEFQDAKGHRLFAESGREMIPADVNGERTYHARLSSNLWESRESLYGLGQHQAGVWDYSGESVDISQDNMNISVPLLVSSNGYGLLWNNASRGRVNNRMSHALYISSEVAEVLDYFFLYGPDLDRVIANYRELTGPAPMFGRWAYGYWQCKNRYKTQEELMQVAGKYRELKIPIDNIVQDWFWWGKMGDHIFNANYPDPKAMVEELHRQNFHLMISVWPFFEAPSANYDELIRRHLYIAPSQGPIADGDGQTLYDPFGAEGRAFYWQKMNDALFKIGVGAWWLDTTEPETENQEDNRMIQSQTALGNGARYANAFPLMTTEAVYEGQRAVTGEKRVFILTRSAFSGMQRYAAAAWSGDVHSRWFELRKQIPAGLNFSLSGLPYWTTDIGGFTDSNIKDPAYQELFVRWFQYGAFCPVFRVHGTRIPSENELWSYGPKAQAILTNFDVFRYRLMPYIYSLAWRTTHEGYTIMRPLVMDFREDERAREIGDQFLFGPAILVSPVIEPGATMRHLYLPPARWYDFWTGIPIEGSRAIDSPSPIERIPLYVRAGSILPLGPDLQYAAERAADPMEIRVYCGASGSFELYEDENDNYNYEKGAYSIIPISWDETAKTLTIGERAGRFPGMLESRTFRVVFVSEAHGIGSSLTQAPDKTVSYMGKSVMVPLLQSH
jgi:alpha-D-xyloside xylohydrolase